jgi:hypothetical protein
MYPRPLTQRERDVLNVLLTADFPDAEALRAQAADVEVVGVCGCGCPSVDFRKEPGVGLHVRVNASIAGGSHDGLFLYTLEGHLGGIEYVGNSVESDPSELPEPAQLVIESAS